MPPITIYSADSCLYCRRAQTLLDRKGANYTVLDVNRDPQLWGEMTARTRRDTVPQIFIGDQHIGGCDDLFALDRRGGLDPLLSA